MVKCCLSCSVSIDTYTSTSVQALSLLKKQGHKITPPRCNAQVSQRFFFMGQVKDGSNFVGGQFHEDFNLTMKMLLSELSLP